MSLVSEFLGQLTLSYGTVSHLPQGREVLGWTSSR